MRSIVQAADPSRAAATRMVWLPGAYHSAQEILDAGFSRALASRRLALDLTLVDLELEHVGDRRPAVFARVPSFEQPGELRAPGRQDRRAGFQ